jgi:hypothetical protein
VRCLTNDYLDYISCGETQRLATALQQKRSLRKKQGSANPTAVTIYPVGCTASEQNMLQGPRSIFS